MTIRSNRFQRALQRLRHTFRGPRGWVAALLVAGALVGTSGFQAGKATPRHPQTGNPSTGAAAQTVTRSGPSLTVEAGLSHAAAAPQTAEEIVGELRFQAGALTAGPRPRMPVALAVVLDTSGSMAGEKISQAKEAVRSLVQNMRGEDQLAVITYNHETSMLAPLQPLSTQRRSTLTRVGDVTAGGGTSIPGALRLAQAQLRNAPAGYVRRAVLVSDGLDGSGEDLTTVARALQEQAAGGQTVSALGIGLDYDENWLSTVVDAGRGNYAFLAQGAELHAFLTRELNESSKTVVDQVEAVLTLPEGVRLKQVTGTMPRTDGQQVALPLGSMMADEERFIAFSLEVSAAAAGTDVSPRVRWRYRTLSNQQAHQLDQATLALHTVATQPAINRTRHDDLFARASARLLERSQKEALDAWNRGDAEEAQRVTQNNLGILERLQGMSSAAATAIAPQASAYRAFAEEAEDVAAAPGSAEGRAVARRARSNVQSVSSR